jgi:hypothetical protein
MEYFWRHDKFVGTYRDTDWPSTPSARGLAFSISKKPFSGATVPSSGLEGVPHAHRANLPAVLQVLAHKLPKVSGAGLENGHEILGLLGRHNLPLHSIETVAGHRQFLRPIDDMLENVVQDYPDFLEIH